MKISDALRQKADYIWQRILNHPFVIELYQGILPIEKFKFYVLQDYNYLVGLTRTLTIIASKSNFDLMRKVLKLAQEEANTELANYERLLEELGLTIEDAIKEEPSPTNYAYMNFMNLTAFLGTPYEGLATIMPCFWSYMEIARHHEKLLKSNENSLYVNWAEVYLSKEYIELVEDLKELLNKASEAEFHRLESVFKRASKYEYMFWDMTYRIERWPI
ncbi:thiaminase II [Thermococci archaeon]|nr:MAG: thiaminase II [Thermococci archaeon]